MRTDIKICGICDIDTLNEVIKSGANFAGFVHCDASPRHLTLNEIRELVEFARGKIYTVVLCVNPNDELLRAISEIKPDYVQLHGDETPQRVTDIITKFKFKLIKAIGVETAHDLTLVSEFPQVALILLDAKASPHTLQTGGHGSQFDWQILRGFKSPKPFFLAGGLTPENVASAIAQTCPYGVDVSSGVEQSKGIKSPHKIRAFCEAVKN